MREIEIKVKVGRPLGELRLLLENAGFEFGEEKFQEDRIYTDPETLKHFDEYTPDANFLRIRSTDNKIIFNFKRSEDSELDSIEHETEIKDGEEMHKILNLLGYVEAVEVRKLRIQGRMGDITVCLDAVEGLGEFLELEKVVEDEANGKEVRKELRKYITDLQIGGEEILRGYDTLVYLKNNKNS